MNVLRFMWAAENTNILRMFILIKIDIIWVDWSLIKIGNLQCSRKKC